MQSYDAFLSYSRKDAGFATLLEAALEAYAPPRGLAVPQRRLAVFRDESDLNGADYYRAIEDQIQRCAKMVVICSPHARVSRFVNDEIHRFARLKSAASIIPIIISGIPNNEAREGQGDLMAFPQALADVTEMPLAVNFLDFDPKRHKLNRGVFYGSWFTLLANIYGVTRESIEERERRRQRRRRWAVGSVTSAIIVTISTAGVVAWVSKLEADRQRIEANRERDEARRQRNEAQRQRGIAVREEKRASDAAAAERKARIASESRELATRAIPLLDQKPQLALLLSAEAIQVSRRNGEPTVDSARSTLEALLRQVQSRPFPAGRPTYLSSTPSRRIVTDDGSDVRVWTIREDGDVTLSWTLRSDGARIDHPHQGRWLVVWKEDGLKLFDTASPGPATVARTLSGRYVTTSPDGRWLVTVQRNEPALWNIETSGTAVRLPVHRGKLGAIVFSRDSRHLVTAGPNGRPLLWTMPLSEPAPEPLRLTAGLATHTVRFSNDGRWLLVANTDSSEGGSGRETVLWNLGRTPPTSFPLIGRSLALAEFSEDSAWLALVGWSDVYQDNHVTFWRLEDTPRPYLLRRRGEETNRIEFKKNWMATGSRYEGFGLLWDLSLLEEAVRLGGRDRESTNRIIDRLIAPVTLSTDQRGFSQVSFLPDGQSVLTLDTAQRLRLFELEAVGGGEKVWQLKSGSPRLLRGHEGRITLCNVHPRTGLVLTGAEGEAPRVWDLRGTSAAGLARLALEQLLVRASKAVGRNLTRAEWQEHFPNRPYEKTFENLP